MESQESSIALTLSSQLMQDYAYTDKPPPLAIAEGDLTAIAGGLLVIQGSNLLFYQPHEGSASGWLVTSINVPTPPTAASPQIQGVKAYDLPVNGGLAVATHLLCLFTATGWENNEQVETGYAVSWLVRTDAHGAWKPQKFDASAEAMLSEVAQVDMVDVGNDTRFVYGVLPNFMNRPNAQYFALRLKKDSAGADDTWTLASLQDCPYRDDLQDFPRLSYLTTRSNQLSLCVRNNAILQWTPPLEVDPNKGPIFTTFPFSVTAPTFSSFFPVTGQDKWTAYGVTSLDDGGQITEFQLTGDGGSNAPVLNRPEFGGPQDVTSIVFSYHESGAISLFAMAGARLWLMRDTEGTTWVALNNVVYALAAPTREVKAAEVFFASGLSADATDITHLSQDLSGSVWIETVFKVPLPPSDPADGPTKPNEISSVTVELAVTYPDKTPLKSPASFSVESDQWVVLTKGGYAYWVGPGRPANFASDALGKASVCFEATDLKFPHLSFAAYVTEHGKPPLTANGGCRGDVIDNKAPYANTAASRLAGNDTKSTTFSMTPQALKAAKLVPPGAADGVTHKLKQIGTFMYTKSGGTMAASSPDLDASSPWRISAEADGTISCTDISREEADALFVGSISSIAGDVFNFLKHATETFGKWTVHVGKDAIRIAVAGYHVVVNTVREAGDLVGTLLASLQTISFDVIDFIKEVVAFLEMLLDFESYLRTHEVLKTILTWGMHYVQAESKCLKGYTDNALKNAATGLDTFLNTIEAMLAASQQTANGYASGLPPKTSTKYVVGASPPYLAGQAYHDHVDNHLSRCMYVFNKAKSVDFLSDAPMSGHSPSYDTMKQTIRNQWCTSDNSKKIKAWKAGLTTNDIDSSNGLDTPLYKLFNLVKGLIEAAFAGIDAVADAILDAMSDAAAQFIEVFDYEPDIPVISWIYWKLIGDKLSALDVICLILAVPATILFDVIEQREPFDDAMVAMVKSAFVKGTTTINFAAFADAAVSGAALPAASDPPQAFVDFCEAIGILGGTINLFGGVLTVAGDGLAIVKAADSSAHIPKFIEKFVSLSSWAFSVTSLIASAPYAMFADTGQTEAETVYIVFWAGGGLPVIYDLVTIFLEDEQLKMVGNWGPGGECLAGFGLAALAIRYVYKDATAKHPDGTAWDYTNAILTSLARPVRGLILTIDDDPDPIPLAIVSGLVVGTDAIGMYGGTATQIGAAIKG